VEIKKTGKALFPQPVSDLLRALSNVGFFDESMLIGSWVMPLYKEFYNISYVLHTMDIDFTIQVLSTRKPRADLAEIIESQGFTTFFTQSGIQKFSREGFTIEFIAHRTGNRDEEPILSREWNITAVALPFINILSAFPFICECSGIVIRAPIPEAFFLHKLIAATRRSKASKKSKDLEQCSAIAPQLDVERLGIVCGSVKLGRKTWAAVRSSCEAINFPPHILGMER
jgi:hypothetical protein